MVVYYVFDLDGTLTDQYSYFYFLADFKPRGVYTEDAENYNHHIDTHLNTELEDRLTTAYTQFVHLVAQRESSSHPLGILRPGIIPVCREILRQQQAGLCGGALMYSNNPNHMVLEFVRDIIHEIVGHPIFIALADWTHPLRASEITEGQPGSAQKTWDVLHKIIDKTSHGHHVTPRRVMFIDDQYHPNLKQVLPVDNYLRVNPYTFKASIDDIKPLYIQAMKYAGVQENHNNTAEVLHYIKNIHSNMHFKNTNEMNSLQNHAAHIKMNSPKAAASGTQAPLPDNSARKMLLDISAFPERLKHRSKVSHKNRKPYTKRNSHHHPHHHTQTKRNSHHNSHHHTHTHKRHPVHHSKKL